jgi:hypothetical protein
MRLTQIARPRTRTPVAQAGNDVFDGRFRELLGADAWHRLPAPIRTRFSKRLQQGRSIAYQGVVTRMQMSWPGFCLAHAARLVGAPLPYDIRSVDQPAVVVVTEDVATNGQFWIRQYGRRGAFPQTVHSSKRFQGPTGLEEYIGFGIGMALTVEATPTALLFKSDHYFLQLFGFRLRLPRWLSPGALVIGHHEMGNDRFTFTLSLRSRWFGDLITQDAVFKDAKE